MRLEEVIPNAKGKNIISDGRRLKNIEEIVERSREKMNIEGTVLLKRLHNWAYPPLY